MSPNAGGWGCCGVSAHEVQLNKSSRFLNKGNEVLAFFKVQVGFSETNYSRSPLVGKLLTR
jgi:hypothetical protein